MFEIMLLVLNMVNEREISIYLHKKSKFGAGQMAWWLSVLAALTDVCLDPNTHIVAHNCM